MQSTWFGDKALPGTFYGKSENGTCFTLILFKTKSNQLYIIDKKYIKNMKLWLNNHILNCAEMNLHTLQCNYITN